MDLKDKQIGKNTTFKASFQHAKDGIFSVIKEERNMKFHIFFSVITIVFGFIMKLTISEWLWIILAIFLVLLAEIVNTCFEVLVDLTTNHSYHPLAKQVKDMAAGGVLLIAVLAVLIGSLIFLPKIWLLIQ